MMTTRLCALAVLLVMLSQGGAAQSPRAPAVGDVAGQLARARAVLGFARADGRLLHYRAASAAEQNYQSDRTYPPFFSAMLQEEVWFDPATAVARVQQQTLYPGSDFSPPAVTVDDGKNVVALQGDRSVPIARRQITSRNLIPWAVIADWSAATDVRAGGAEIYRDYMRVVLVRTTPEGEQRLYLDGKTGFPVKLTMVEPHYLWGQRQAEYLWTTWTLQNGVPVPGGVFLLADGATEISQTIGVAELVARGSVPPLAPPAAAAEPPAELPRFLQPIAPTTRQVSERTWLLINPGYTEAITQVGDEIYVFDATQGEARARQDADAIEKLFPGPHKISVVVTDLAWPHVAGVRYWVSRGATIIGHGAARSFLQRVVDRHWTLAPDSLERQRQKDAKSVRLKFVNVQDAVSFASGAVRLFPIDGIGSEIALMGYIAADRFLWASDYIQTLSKPSLYATEVIAAAQRAGVVPERVAAQHLPLSDWNTVVAAQQPK